MNVPAQTFIRVCLGAFVAMIVSVYLFIVLIDPYDNIPFSLPLERAPVSTNQRFAYPALARSQGFDSAIIGSSTVRLLNPEQLKALSGASFVNLAMNSGTAYEQSRIHELFIKHHESPKAIVFGIDDSWCRREEKIEKYTFRTFPEWMYDDNPWNDLLFMFNDKAMENTVRLVELMAGAREPKYERDGYRDFTVDFGEYDRVRAVQKLYPNGRAQRATVAAKVRDGGAWRYAAHDLFDTMLMASKSSQKNIVLLVPFHHAYQVRGANNYHACKKRIKKIAQDRKAHVIDMMVESPITTNDDNYWDPLHYRNVVARQIELEIAELLAQ